MNTLTLSVIVAAILYVVFEMLVKHNRKKNHADILDSETETSSHIRISSTVDLGNRLKG